MEIIPVACLYVSGYNSSMEFFTAEQNVEKVPPSEMRFINLQAQPSTDGGKVRIVLEITPFQQSPFIDIVVHDSHDSVIGTTSIIEPASWKMEVTLHLRNSPEPNETCKISAVLYHPEFGEIDYQKTSFNMSEISE